ncbi:hypothetical protein IscW_ISCW005226 [Ixodes scapularis]|uniref:Uncharacterized protein n=1 Tax=Ixodes scapularis TaxID=6945 RepID=B7PGX7_IXOSC|nr:hypothetical protein IscW_ISCW005226 [Ixodes scapularis]|eukprot:XP_002401583.1 hypothetical protein IscW_ISCW005226 [Ixodes scapularis]
MDPDLWEAPEEFRPERFLSKDGSRLIDKPDWLVPFSVAQAHTKTVPTWVK